MQYPTPLPPSPFPEDASGFQAAYQRCLALESAAPGVKAHPQYPPPLVCARILGHLLRLAPEGNGQAQVQQDIISTADDAQLMEVANVYLNGLIRTFSRNSGTTPVLSSHPSRPSFEDARQYNMEVMQGAKLDHRKARRAALHRDNHRCLITGKAALFHGGITFIQAAHIIPESTNTRIEQNHNKRFHSAGVWAILSMFTDVNIIMDLMGDKIHRLENILSLSGHCHHLFDALVLWFKPVEGSPHKYRVHLRFEEWRETENIPEFVTFSTKTDLPLPNGAFLALHALCCEIASMSGAAEYIMELERRMDDTRVLANDGSTADLLASALALVAVQ